MPKPNPRNGPRREPTIADLESGLAINEEGDGLEESARQQPDLFFRVSKALALALSRRDAAKQSLQEIEAECDLKERRNAEAAGEKVTETGFKNAVMLSPKVKAAKDKLGDLNEETGLLGALKESYQQRSYALNHLVDLYLAHFYASASTNNAQYRENRRKLHEARTTRE